MEKRIFFHRRTDDVAHRTPVFDAGRQVRVVPNFERKVAQKDENRSKNGRGGQRELAVMPPSTGITAPLR
jgi:hypothetical protein